MHFEGFEYNFECLLKYISALIVSIVHFIVYLSIQFYQMINLHFFRHLYFQIV